MKKAVITRADDNIKEMTDITLPVMKKYAESMNCDFIILDHNPPFLTLDNKPHYRILKVYDLFEEYDRILHFDADMLINKNCPNIFEIVPEDMIGVIFEDKGSRQNDRRYKIQNVQRVWGNVDWSVGYTNSGTLLLSKQHRNVFLSHNGQYWLDEGSGDIHISYNIHKYGFNIYELEYKWNHMTMFSEPWNNYANRFNSYVIHYGGRGIFDNNVQSKIEQIRKDYDTIYK
jgi:hypothetical protein